MGVSLPTGRLVEGSMLPLAVGGGAGPTGLTARDGKPNTSGKKDERSMRKWRCMGGWTRGLIVLFREEEGQALAEYSLILAFVAMACVLALGALGLALAGQLDVVTAGFP